MSRRFAWVALLGAFAPCVARAAALEAAPLAPALVEAVPDPGDPGSSERRFLTPGERIVPWSRQPERWFGSLEFDAGFLYVRPRLAFGYGQPHATWAGVELNPIVTDEGVAAYAGVRFALPGGHLRVGGRYWSTFRRSFLLPQSAYTVEDIELRDGPKSRFLTWESELSFNVPLGPGGLLLELAASAVTGVAAGYFVYEETLRAVVDPPWVWRARTGYMWSVDRDGSLQLGPVLELLGVPRRGTLVFRAGGLVRVTLSADLEARGTFVPAALSPDDLGARGGDAFLLGIRYRWATGP